MAITPPDNPAVPEKYAQVAVQPMDIQAPMEDLSGAFTEAGRLSGGQENDIYGVGPRQQASAALIQSQQGFGSDGYDVIDGWHGGGGDGWPNDVEPDVAGP